MFFSYIPQGITSSFDENTQMGVELNCNSVKEQNELQETSRGKAQDQLETKNMKSMVSLAGNVFQSYE